jgi:hypothetical protein
VRDHHQQRLREYSDAHPNGIPGEEYAFPLTESDAAQHAFWADVFAAIDKGILDGDIEQRPANRGSEHKDGDEDTNQADGGGGRDDA